VHRLPSVRIRTCRSTDGPLYSGFTLDFGQEMSTDRASAVSSSITLNEPFVCVEQTPAGTGRSGRPAGSDAQTANAVTIRGSRFVPSS